MRALAVALLLGASAAPPAEAAVSIRAAATQLTAPGTVSGAVEGYLGPRSWPMHVSLVPVPRLEFEWDLYGTPTARYPPSRRPAIRLGTVARTGPWVGTGSHPFTFPLPRLRPGLYWLVVFCGPCTAGPRGSLIRSRDAITVRRR